MTVCGEETEHNGHGHTCTVELAAPHAGIKHMAKCGARLHRWEDAPSDAGKSIACGDTEPPARQWPPAPAQRVMKLAAAAGWIVEMIETPGSTEATVKLARGNERGHVTWELNGEGAWRFSGALIGGRRYGAREIAKRLAEAVPGSAVSAEDDGAAPAAAPAPVLRPELGPDGPPPPHLATVHPIRPDVAAQLAPPPPAAVPAAPAMPTGTLASFMGAAPRALPVNGNTEWGTRYAGTLREIIEWNGRNSARNLQVHLGPSELGEPCNRQVVWKMAGLPATNHVTDPWPSIVGTSIHGWLADAFKRENERHGLRWVPEYRVTPHPEHPGTADLYDAAEQAVVDWKNLSHDKIAKLAAEGPSVQYQVQLRLYGRGYANLGLPVRRVVLVALPRTKSSLDGMYVWDHEWTSADDEIIEEVFRLTTIRKTLADEIQRGRDPYSIDTKPDHDSCYFCPFYRPQADGSLSCPGTQQ